MKSYLFLANGFEEIEALATIDIMRRAGMDVSTVSINADTTVTGANGIKVSADCTIDSLSPDQRESAEWLIVPGGNDGSTNLAADGRVSDMLTSQWRSGRRIAAICAAPAVVLGPLGIVRGQNATGYPTLRQQLVDAGATYIDQRVVISGKLITSNGPSSALAFAFAIVAETLGTDVASAVASGMLV